jgi:hypothetical protein
MNKVSTGKKFFEGNYYYLNLATHCLKNGWKLEVRRFLKSTSRFQAPGLMKGHSFQNPYE